MNPSIVQIIQNYINVIEGIFDREPAQLSTEEYDEYLQALKDCRLHNVFPHARRENEIENYLHFEINGV